jgi:hypothetical protein
MAIIAASFPYRKQLDEFRRALRLATIEDVLAAQVPVGADKTAPAFRFLGVELERRLLGGDGKSVSPWTAVDLAEAYRPWMLRTGKRMEPDLPLLVAVSPLGLVMPQVIGFARGGCSPYPPIHENLPKLLKTMKAAEEAMEKGLLPREVEKEGPDPFAPVGGEPAPKRPGGKMESFIPEHCLLRVIDPTIEPGKTYLYRLRVRMGDPSPKRKEASAKDAELRSATWYEVPQTVSLPPEMVYYAADLEGSGPRERLRPPAHDPTRQAVLEIHRWLDAIQLDGEKGPPMLVGDWAIATGVAVARGEYVQATQDIQVPVWSCVQDCFVLSVDSHGRRAKKETIRVSFSHDEGSGDDPLVIDFEGGARTYRRSPQEARILPGVPTRIQDAAPREVLLMTPAGKLIARNSATDTTDPERNVRQQASRTMIDAIKKESGTNLFGP